MVMLWGRDGVMIYNDAYSVFAAQRHPFLLGSKVLEGWPEVADFNAEVMRVGLAGETLSFNDQNLTLYRNNVAEEVWMDLNYSPVLDESGRPAGVIAIVLETTAKVMAERALSEERENVLEMNRRLTAESNFLRDLFEQAPSFMSMTVGAQHRIALANRAYKSLVGSEDLIGRTVDEALPGVGDQGYIKVLDRVFATGEPYIASGAKVALFRTPGEAPEDRFLDFIDMPIRNAAGEITGIFTQGQDVTERLRSEQHLRLLINELNHRVKNTLAIMQSVAAQTFRSAENLPQAQEAFSARIMALSRANDLLTGGNWESASLADVIATASYAHAGDDASRIAASGPSVRLSAKTALSLAMAIHELATNAAKYGALSTATGRVRIDWRIDAADKSPRLHLEWRESGGPEVQAPKRRGFGSRLIERGLAAELGGKVELSFEPAGLACVIDAPLDLYADVT
jgi:PAS domain S-box-containing protein